MAPVKHKVGVFIMAGIFRFWRVSSFYTASSWGLMFDVYSVFLLRETTDSVFIILKFSEVGDK